MLTYCSGTMNVGLIFRFHRAEDEIGINAIKHAMRALRKRHLAEEGAHAPAFTAISKPIASQVPFLYSHSKIFFSEISSLC